MPRNRLKNGAEFGLRPIHISQCPKEVESLALLPNLVPYKLSIQSL